MEPVALRRPTTPSRLEPANSAYVLEVLDRAIDGCLAGKYDAMVTAPVQKSIINDAGIAFSGHTEYLAARARAGHVVMMLVGGGERFASRSPPPIFRSPRYRAPSTRNLVRTLRVIDAELKNRFRIPRPRILVCGLNPHSGEGGHFGREDSDVMRPRFQRPRRAASTPKARCRRTPCL